MTLVAGLDHPNRIRGPGHLPAGCSAAHPPGKDSLEWRSRVVTVPRMTAVEVRAAKSVLNPETSITCVRKVQRIPQEPSINGPKHPAANSNEECGRRAYIGHNSTKDYPRSCIPSTLRESQVSMYPMGFRPAQVE